MLCGSVGGKQDHRGTAISARITLLHSKPTAVVARPTNMWNELTIQEEQVSRLWDAQEFQTFQTGHSTVLTDGSDCHARVSVLPAPITRKKRVPNLATGTYPAACFLFPGCPGDHFGAHNSHSTVACSTARVFVDFQPSHILRTQPQNLGLPSSRVDEENLDLMGNLKMNIYTSAYICSIQRAKTIADVGLCIAGTTMHGRRSIRLRRWSARTRHLHHWGSLINQP